MSSVSSVITKLAMADPRMGATLEFRTIEAGPFARKDVLDIFMRAEIEGADVSYKENRGLFGTTFYNISIKGSAGVLCHTAKLMRNYSII